MKTEIYKEGFVDALKKKKFKILWNSPNEYKEVVEIKEIDKLSKEYKINTQKGINNHIEPEETGAKVESSRDIPMQKSKTSGSDDFYSPDFQSCLKDASDDTLKGINNHIEPSSRNSRTTDVKDGSDNECEKLFIQSIKDASDDVCEEIQKVKEILKQFHRGHQDWNLAMWCYQEGKKFKQKTDNVCEKAREFNKKTSKIVKKAKELFDIKDASDDTLKGIPKEAQASVCEDCGLEEKFHTKEYREKYYDIKPCKKFKPRTDDVCECGHDIYCHVNGKRCAGCYVDGRRKKICKKFKQKTDNVCEDCGYHKCRCNYFYPNKKFKQKRK